MSASADLHAAIAAQRTLSGLPDAAPLAEVLELARFETGEAIVREGATDGDLFFVQQGHASILRGEVDVGQVGPGDHFGEMALLAEAPRAATVRATEPMTALRLSRSAFEQLAADHPALALALLRRLVRGVSGWLTDMTASVEAMLRERSLPRRTRVGVVLGGRLQPVRTGTRLAELLPETHDGEFVVAALVDRRPVSLVTAVTSDAVIEPLTTAHWEGGRIYRTSLALLLLEAAKRCRPDLTICMEHSLGFAQHVSVEGDVGSLPELANALTNAMLALVDADVPLREELWTAEEARTHFTQTGWRTAADLLATWRDATVPMVSYGEVYALELGPLVHRTGVLSGFCLLPDPRGLLLIYGSVDPVVPHHKAHAEDPPQDPIKTAATTASRHAEAMLADHRRWLAAIGTTSVGGFNRACVDGDVPKLIRIVEGYHEKRISQIADAIAARREDIDVVCVAGPSSSGKTTFIKRLEVQLQVNGLRPRGLSLDDYYVGRAETPRDEAGELDYETLDALEIGLLQQQVGRLLEGEEVTTARYDFVAGESDPTGGRTIRLRDDDLLLLEGIHGLNPRLLHPIDDARIFRIYISPLAQLPFDRLSRVRASDLRLLRRIVRDRHRRGSNAADAILRWPSVRRGERFNIFPFGHHADEVFDSSLIYEVSVLKVLAEIDLLEVPPGHPASPTAHRLLRLLDRFVTIYPDHVPPTSLLREFIGGSGFDD